MLSLVPARAGSAGATVFAVVAVVYLFFIVIIFDWSFLGASAPLLLAATNMVTFKLIVGATLVRPGAALAPDFSDEAPWNRVFGPT